MRTLRIYLPATALCAAGLVLIALFFFLPTEVEQLVPPAPVRVWASGTQVSVQSTDQIPANLLAKAGQRLFPGDRLLMGGREISPNTALTNTGAVLQVITGIPVSLTDGANQRTFSSSAATVGEALWQAGIRWNPSDQLDPAPETPLDRPFQVTLRRAVPLTITHGGQTLTLRSAAPRVGEALADAGLSLQGLDTTQPAEDQPVPADGRIRVVRVQEQVLLEQKTIPFKSQYQPDPATELDQRSVVQPGVTGLIVARVRVRTEDGKEVSRQKETEWTAREPKDQLVGYGTKVVVHTETVDGATIQYWRKLTAYATSYSPCTIYTDHCSYNTASGGTLAKGVVAVIRSWYNQLKGAQVYIPGYGQATIADIGGGVGGQNWVDLGYSEGDYVGWHQNVTLYFLAPAPANIGWALP